MTRRVTQRARAQRDAIVGQMRVHMRKERLGQPVPLQQVAEVEDGDLIEDAIIAQLDPGKAAHRLAVIQRLLSLGIAQRVPVLQEVDP